MIILQGVPMCALQLFLRDTLAGEVLYDTMDIRKDVM